ncbi:MAG: LTA synthase family protein [Cytophaga sp.]|uniref:LTA synthase family protein n=1 Tax=Cytophaga sp. TaxID=29535 RepID=UPI003F7CDA99
MVYHIKPILRLPIQETLLSFIYGLTLDISFASYITILPAAILPVLLLINIKTEKVQKLLRYYTLFWTILIAFIYTLDAELFSFWGFRLDNTLFRYTGTFSEMLGSTLSSPLLILLPFFFIFAYIFYKVYLRFFHEKKFITIHFWQLPVSLILAAALVIPIRGGLQQIPNNESVAYYSTSSLLNQAALNPLWTLARSVIEQNGPDLARYRFFDSKDAEKLMHASLQQTFVNDSILKNNRPNIILIVWESLTAKVVDSLVTPKFTGMKKDGIYFSSMYASGDRSDKGLVALLSAYPAQPDYSIMTEPGKSRRLPFVTQQLRDAGYKTGYIYGGELEFANMRSYMNYNGFDQIIGKSDFPKETWGAKWGAHDEFTFNKLFSLAEEQSRKPEPFFYTLFTLSSHEPFDVPAKPVIPGNSKTIQFQNAHHYTDSCFNAFINKAKKQAWWNNTWIIVVADHGHVLPGSEYASHQPSEFKIPMLWLGGAITRQKEISSTYSQINLAPTIAAYLGLKPREFKFSNPMNLSDTSVSSAWYSFNDGFARVSSNSRYMLYNLNSKNISEQKGTYTAKEIEESQAFLQVLMEDFYQK